jgi:hypothetical protein
MRRPPKNAASDASSAAGRTPPGAKAKTRNSSGASTSKPKHQGGIMEPATEVKSPAAALAADEGDILIEQLEYLLDHVEAAGAQCACSECKRYARARAVLMEIFK